MIISFLVFANAHVIAAGIIVTFFNYSSHILFALNIHSKFLPGYITQP